MPSPLRVSASWRRRGITLTEVLVAIFVMGIGLMGLMVLYPLGALTMGDAIKDDRSTNLAAAASGIAHIQWQYYSPPSPTLTPYSWDLRTDPNYFPFTLSTPPVGGYTNPYAVQPITAATQFAPSAWYGGNQQWPPVNSGSSYPFYIDPVGMQVFKTPYKGPPLFGAGPPNNGLSTGSLPGTSVCGLIKRESPSFLKPASPHPVDPNLDTTLNPFSAAYLSAKTARWCSLMDELLLDESGQPTLPVSREGRYSCAWLCRWMSVSSIQAPIIASNKVAMTVVVYSGRPLTVYKDGTPATETPYQVTFTPGSNSVTLTYDDHVPAVPPNIRKGGWILDATMPDPLTPSQSQWPMTVRQPQGYFYRVTNITDPGDGAHIYLELQMPVRTSTGYFASPADGLCHGVFVVMDNVVEVFDRGIN